MPYNYKVQLKQASNGNRYFTTSFGVLEFDTVATLYRPAGLPRGLDIQLALTAGTLLTNNDNVGYRMLWGIRDLNNNVPLGAPSSRVTIRATGAQDVNVTFLIPAYITTAHFFQIYRTKILNGAALDPGDEMFLVYEGNPSAADLAAGSITITDARPDIMLGPPLYTNASQEGILKANNQPPLARDLEEFRNCMCYANITSKQRLALSLVGVASFTAGTSTITIGGVTYNCAAYGGAYSTSPAGENTATGVFVYYTAGTIAERIRGTAESLLRVVNRYGLNTQYYGFYISQVDDTPGQMLFEERGIGGVPFAATAHSSIINNFEPKLQTTGTFVSSSADRKPNRLYVSKPDQPGAVPTLDYFDVGPANEAIHRILKLRDTLIIIKDRSVWQMSGTSIDNFAVSLLDATIQTADRFNSAATMNNRVYLLCSQGIAAISPSGVELVSGPEDFGIRQGTVDYDGFSNGVGHEYLRSYVCSTYDHEFKSKGYTYPFAAYVHSEDSEIPMISRWLINANCMAVFKNRLYYGLNNDTGKVLKQRAYAPYETPEVAFFCDEQSVAAISNLNVNAKTATIAFTPSVNYDTYPSQFGYGYQDGFDKGFAVVDLATDTKWLVVAWDPATNAATFNDVTGMANNTSYPCFRPIPFHVGYMPVDGGNPCSLKQFEDVILRGEIDDTYEIKFLFANERDKKSVFHYYVYQNQLSLPSQTRPLNDVALGFRPRNCTPFKAVKAQAPDSRKRGTQLSVIVTNNVAASFFFIKALGVEVRDTNSDELGYRSDG